jgi:hypothetical protein
VQAHGYGIADYTAALRASGFADVACDRLRLPPADYEQWVRERGNPEPNPAWFPTAAEERRYYTEIGKVLILARRRTTHEEPPAAPNG